jgi:DNA-binding NarL/FixJ family response regulator
MPGTFAKNIRPRLKVASAPRNPDSEGPAWRFSKTLVCGKSQPMKLDEPSALLGTEISPSQKRLLVVDDHPVFRHGLRRLLDEEKDLEICGEAETAQEGLKALRRLRPDGILLDVSLPGTNGIEFIKLALAEQANVAILVLSMHDESLYALRALRAGAKGYVMKREATDHVLDAIRTVMAGGVYVSSNLSERLVFKAIYSNGSDPGSPIDRLSDRELEVLQLLGGGRSTKQIAETLFLSVKTIETHRAHIKRKLGFKDANEMVKFAVEWTAVGQN